MIHKNLTPFHYGPKVTSRNPPQCEATITVRGVFTIANNQPPKAIEGILEQGFMTGDVWYEDDEDRVGMLKYASDFADFKPYTDIIVTGSCHTPGGKPLATCPVRVQVGEWEKTLMVVGQRLWQPKLIGATMSPPIPFTQLPLDWSMAFGGEGFADNPSGRGFKMADLPTIEYPSSPIRGRGDRPTPAGFGPISPEWPLRKRKRGRKYGKDYEQNRKPWYSEDFDWSFFNAAPPDQQLPFYLRGDEMVVFQNMHPSAEVFSFQLPKLRIRVFVKDVDADFREVEMVCDTLCADLDESKLYLTWRGLTPCQQDDMTDLKVALIASEPLDSEPLPEAHYKELLEDYEADPIGLKDHLPEGFQEAADSAQKMEDAGLTPQEMLKQAGPDGGDNPLASFLKNKMGGLEAGSQAQVSDLMSQSASLWGQSPMPLQPDMNAIISGGLGNIPAPMAPIPPVAPPQMALGQIMSQVASARGGMIASGAPPEATAKMDELLNHPDLKKLDANYEVPEAKVPDDIAKAPTKPGENVEVPQKKPAGDAPPDKQTDDGKRDLSGKDYSGQDLRHEDFSNCKLHGTVFMRCNLTGVKFTGSDMKSANFFRAICDECDFSDADCKMALFDKASLANAVFRNACLEHTGFDKAKAPGLLLEGATGVYTRFTGTDLTRAKAANSKLETPIFDDSTLEDADFTGAKLIKASLRAVKARGIILNEADVTAFCAGMKADLREAKCISLVGDRSIWENADLTGADFSFSSLQRAFFPEANCAKAVFYACNLSDSMMRKARLHAASFVQANLRNAELPKAECIGTDFSGSNLYETVFMDATVLECNFTGASRAHIIPRP